MVSINAHIVGNIAVQKQQFATVVVEICLYNKTESSIFEKTACE